jgi:dienelactone hydrolase
VARTLETAGFATLLIDLLEEPEAENRRNVFDIRLLAGRLAAAMEWLRQEERTSHLPLGLFGASTGAAAALVAAADRAEAVAAVVSRGGRPDLAMDDLPRVMAPTLLLVGSGDVDVLELNRAAMTRMTCETELVVIKGATHLFPEPGALEEVARLATEWFLRHLR